MRIGCNAITKTVRVSYDDNATMTERITATRLPSYYTTSTTPTYIYIPYECNTDTIRTTDEDNAKTMRRNEYTLKKRKQYVLIRKHD